MNDLTVANGHRYDPVMLCLRHFLGDQYLSIAMPGTMLRSAFDDKGSSRDAVPFAEDRVMPFILIPWEHFAARTIRRSRSSHAQYMPYAFLNYLNPIVAIVLTYMGIGIFWRGKDGEPVKGGKTRPADLV